MKPNPLILFTMGDVAGVGPEIIAKAWPELMQLCRPVVVGDAGWLRRAAKITDSQATVREIVNLPDANPTPESIPCMLTSGMDVSGVKTGAVSAAAGQAAFDYLCAAADLAIAGQADAIVTSPLHKEGLRAAGLPYPGHTEILAERTGVSRYAMLLHTSGLSVIHATLHTALKDIFQLLTPERILEKIELLDRWLPNLLDRRPRIGVAALNPHASDGGLFGTEEIEIIEPAIAKAREQGIDASGPWPADTLFTRARENTYDGIVAMYHDQGHIAMKLLGFGKLVNVTVGLPIIRTSVAHGTAYDIAGRGIAEHGSLVEAARVAARLAWRQAPPEL